MSPPTYVQVCWLRGSLAGRMFAYVDPAPVTLPKPLVMGRGPDCHIRFQDTTDIMVSRHHAQLEVVSGGVRYVDASSQGTYQRPSQQRISTCEIARGQQVTLQLGPSGPVCQIGVGLAIPFGSFSLVAKLGEGGMAEVYIAGDSRLDRFVVLKLLRTDLRQSDPHAEKNLLNEARIVAQLEHNNVVRIYELGELGGIPYIAMEYLRGISLGQLDKQLKVAGKRLSPALAAAIVRQACLGLHAAHELPSKVVHRDISLNNILITRDTVKVIDFGIARADSPDGSKGATGNLTRGCPPYMSPEQISTPSSVTRLSDIWSMAVVLYELCSGEHLFSRDSLNATIAAVVTEEPAPLRSVCAQASPRLEALLRQALNKRPAERWPTTAAEMAAELKEEAGPELLHHDNIVSALEQLGVELHGSPPVPLVEEPALVRRARPVPPVPARAAPPAPPPPAPPPPPPAVPALLLRTAPPPPPRDTGVRAVPVASGLLAVDLPAEGGSFVVRTQQVGQLAVSSHPLDGRDYREPVPLRLDLEGLVVGCPQPLVLALANRLVELRVAPETLKSGRSFRIYPSELSTAGARNSYALPLPCAGKQLVVGHHRGEQRTITVASGTASQPDGVPAALPLAELGVSLQSPAGTDRLFVVYSKGPEPSYGHLVCFTVRRE